VVSDTTGVSELEVSTPKLPVEEEGLSVSARRRDKVFVMNTKVGVLSKMTRKECAVGIGAQRGQYISPLAHLHSMWALCKRPEADGMSLEWTLTAAHQHI